jgi:hypothetical protein
MVTPLGVLRENVFITFGLLREVCGYSFGRAQKSIVVYLGVPKAWHLLGCSQGRMWSFSWACLGLITLPRLIVAGSD